ncbi:MAG: UvrD-helicase domain-containing protein [Eubacterium sp.]|nr:UvrD-helicase domain-containing protein [Eubacterium sp.]
MGIFDSIINRFKSKIEYKKELSQNIKELERELRAFLKQNSNEYIYRYSYKDLDNRCKELELLSVKNHVSVKSLQSSVISFYRDIELHNNQVLDKKIKEGYSIIGDVEGQQLDPQQMACIVKDADSHIVVAGAGTGKTTTILGKVKYLLNVYNADPQDFLILSFTNAAADEMKKRLHKETNKDFYVATFHKLGYDIIRRTQGITPKVFENGMNSFVNDYVFKDSLDAAYKRKMLNYVLYHNVKVRSEFSFEDEDEYKDYLKTNPPTSIKDEVLKSYGEMEIANFLAQHGINYQYEAAYPLDTRDEEYGQYHPDFYLPDYNIYIEYFGIDRKGNVPDYFSDKDGKSASEIYREGIEWKRRIHKENGTTLIECYAYEHFEGMLLNNLKEKLSGVEMRDLSLEEIVGSRKGKNILSTLSNTMATVITLCKNRRIDSQGIKSINCDAALVELIFPVFVDYETFLTENNYVDFADMLNQATDAVVDNKFEHVFKYVIVDEYQDISTAQYQLLKALRNQSHYSLFCVGDDWQSIYRFAGSDIGYILNFDKYWGDSELSRIETTYRFSQRLIDISSNFVMSNPNQIKKQIRSGNNIEQYVIGNINGYTEQNAISFMVDKVKTLPQNSTVYFLGRYQFDIDCLGKGFTLRYDNANKVNQVILQSRPDLKMYFYTVHKSKGLQADYVFILNNKNTYMGFPSKVQNPPLIEYLLEQSDDFPDSEERRLFYVALTRARRRVYLVTEGKKISSFANEIISKYGEEIKKEAWTCPLCGGQLRKVKGPYGEFYGCSNYRVNGCRYKRNLKA